MEESFKRMLQKTMVKDDGDGTAAVEEETDQAAESNIAQDLPQAGFSDVVLEEQDPVATERSKRQRARSMLNIASSGAPENEFDDNEGLLARTFPWVFMFGSHENNWPSFETRSWITGAMKSEAATPRAENLGHRAVLEKTFATSRAWRILESPNIIIPQNAQAQVADSSLIFPSSFLSKPSEANKSTFSFAIERDHASFSATARTLLPAHLEREALIKIAAFSRLLPRPLPPRFPGILSKTIKKANKKRIIT
jgi:hypothetical protein